jgi:hypothetical protein
MPHTKLDFRSLFLHAWDLADDGVDAVMGEIAETGLNAMCFAGTYHNGWFIHPHAKTRRTFMTEGSVCYFHPQASLYKSTRLKPLVSAICRRKDWLAEAVKRLDRHGLRLVSWTIGTHNTRLGLMHPRLTQQNVYGDRVPHALCPANDDVRAYLIAICRDLATNYPMWALQLESFGWMNIAHGHHHERDLVGLSTLERELLSLCVCGACTRKVTKAGVDVAATIATVRAVLDGAFRNAPHRPKHHPRTMAQLERRSPDLRAFNAWRKRYGEAFIRNPKGRGVVRHVVPAADAERVRPCARWRWRRWRRRFCLWRLRVSPARGCTNVSSRAGAGAGRVERAVPVFRQARKWRTAEPQ